MVDQAADDVVLLRLELAEHVVRLAREVDDPLLGQRGVVVLCRGAIQ